MELIGIIINVFGFVYMYYKLQQIREQINSITKELRPRKKAEIEERKRDAREQTAEFMKAQNVKSDIYY